LPGSLVAATDPPCASTIAWTHGPNRPGLIRMVELNVGVRNPIALTTGSAAIAIL